MTETKGTTAADAAREEAGERCCGVVALIGAPNVGKSTLVNQLVGAKVSIVTHKVQTTRARVRGVLTEGRYQIILVDTPGIFAPRRRLDRAMVEAAWHGAQDADIVVFIVDAQKGADAASLKIIEQLGRLKSPVVLALNKIDRIKKERLLALAGELNEKAGFSQTFMISALLGSGVAELKTFMCGAIPEGPWLYPEDELSDLPMRMLASELTREKLYLRLHQELPYASTVETTDWKQLRNGSVRIEQTIFVERASQKQIVVGQGGKTIKAISSETREELKGILDVDVHLFLFVKVREKWGDDPARFREMGLEFPKD